MLNAKEKSKTELSILIEQNLNGHPPFLYPLILAKEENPIPGQEKS